MNSFRQLACLGIAGALVMTLAPSLASAQVDRPRARVLHGKSHPLAQQHVRTVPVPLAIGNWHAVRRGSHMFYGTIYALNGAALTVRLRSGEFIAVNAAAAIAGGNYSAPLFVGKPVSVDGNAADGTFTATHIFRLPGLIGLGPDS